MDGSSGISEDEGMRLQPFSSKNARYFSRISELFTDKHHSLRLSHVPRRCRAAAVLELPLVKAHGIHPRN